MKKQILMALFIVSSLSVFAVTLPKSSYSPISMTGANEIPFTLDTRTHVVSTLYLGSYDGVCTTEEEWGATDIQPCSSCCNDKVFIPCISQYEMIYGDNVPEEQANECLELTTSCQQTCDWALNEKRGPLGTPLMLLPFALAYVGFMYYRRRRENAEQA